MYTCNPGTSVFYFNLDDFKLLNKLCDEVIDMKVSIKDLLEEDEHCVSSTPVKLTPPPKRKGSASSRELKEAEILSEVTNATSIQAASKQAYQLFGKTSKVKRVRADKPALPIVKMMTLSWHVKNGEKTKKLWSRVRMNLICQRVRSYAEH